MLFDRITGNLFKQFHLSRSDIHLSLKLSYMPPSEKNPQSLTMELWKSL